MIRNFFRNLKSETNSLNYGREIIVNWVSEWINKSNRGSFRILDVGMGPGEDLLGIREKNNQRNLELFGLDMSPAYVEIRCKKWNKFLSS